MRREHQYGVIEVIDQLARRIPPDDDRTGHLFELFHSTKGQTGTPAMGLAVAKDRRGTRRQNLRRHFTNKKATVFTIPPAGGTGAALRSFHTPWAGAGGRHLPSAI